MPDWEAIKSEYITTRTSYRKLSEKWGVSFRTLSDRANREGWFEARNKYRNSVVERTVQKAASYRSSANANKLLKIQESADKISDAVAKVLEDTEQFTRYIVTVGLGGGETKVEERNFKKADTKAIKDLAGAIKDLACVMRNVYDLPTKQEQAAMDNAAARLRLEQAKAEAEDAGSEDIIVEFGGDEQEGWAE